MKKGYVIIVTYNGLKWIDECLKSVVNSSFPVIPVVVDNNSTDKTVSFIKENFPNVILFEQTKNLGFGKANNLGMSYALNKDADFVFLLNQDAFLEKDTIRDLVQVANKHPEYGILSPIQLDYSGTFLEKYFLQFTSKDKACSLYSDLVIGNKIKDVYAVEFIQAAAWFLPINTLKNIGGFDPIFYHYGEDDNYCQRVRYYQLKIGIVPATFIRHDTNKPSENSFKTFSKKYYSIYKKDICINYANINKTLKPSVILKARKIIHIKIIKSFVKLNFKNVLGYYKELRIFNKTLKLIEHSRKINSKIKANYLN
ncbi:glycosyltransferase family 2 protein [Litoribaculum gwangyangense]|uniref:Glycosyltransferase family 2 protein n=1 Tax=Litoribaculum gwangyangense TaxID=1130722 RepID=A0ABP9CVN5_9FLAO